jgi:signal transduction histidine kinase
VREAAQDIPFIFLSGTINEDTAVDAMRSGANDYMMKGNAKRLLPAIRRELAEAQIRRRREQVEKDLRLRDERIRILHDINTAISSTLDLSSLLELLFEKMEALLAYSGITVALCDKTNRLAEPIVSRHLDPNEWKSQPHDQDPSHVVFLTKATLVIQNLAVDARVQGPAFYRRHNMVSYAGVPLIAKDQSFGTIGFYTREEHNFLGDELQFLETLAGQVAVAIHNSRLYEEIKSQATELEKANEVKSEFLSIISHELRTPLNVMMGYVGLVQEGALGEIKREQSDALEKSLHHSRQLLDMITDIVQATRMQEQKNTISAVNMAQIIGNLKHSFGEACAKKNLVFDLDIAPEFPIVKSDGEKLTKLLENLIDNAIKFTQIGSVAVCVRQLDENKMELRVADTGIGISADKVPLIFQIFYQIDSSSTRRHGGLGLGLYVVQTNATLLGGSVDVESEPGKGSTFIVTLPIDVA